MKIQLVTNYWHFHSEKQSTRYGFLTELLQRSGHEVEVITSTFRHATKQHRDTAITNEATCKVTMLKEPGYPKNISLQRLHSHDVFARRAVTYLSRTKPPDVIYCVVPPLSAARRVGAFAHEKRIPLVMDVQDLWPDAFAMAVGNTLPARLGMRILTKRSTPVYEYADAVVAVSDTYRRRALGSQSIPSATVYLGIDLRAFDTVADAPSLPKPPDEFWIVYAGALGHSYDLPVLIEACALAQRHVRHPLRLLILGDGARRRELEAKAAASGIYCSFMGQVAYADMVRILRQSDLSANPIVPASAATIINKHGDYLAAGLPMLNNQTSPELRGLLAEWNAGTNCAPGSAVDMAEGIIQLYKSPQRRHSMGRNARKLAEVRFDRNETYPQIVEIVERVGGH